MTDINGLLVVARAKVDAMTDEERAAMYEAQKRSWARGEKTLGEWERSITRAAKE